MSNKKPSVMDRAMLAMQVQSPSPSPPVGNVGPAKPKTGPGSLVAYLQQESEVVHENAALKTELSKWSEALPTKKIDPALIDRSAWANRHEDSFSSAEFNDLKAEISAAGGNVQPIKVRPIPGANPQRYEVIFGHRRHRACQELGIQVLAVVESITDAALFVEMDRENRNREDLRPYEQGAMYARALDLGLYPSLRALAAAINLQPGNVSTAVKIARLPAAVLNAFLSPLDIQYRWAAPLSELVEKDHAGVVAKAKEIQAARKRGEEISAAGTMDRLIGRVKAASSVRRIEVSGKVVATLTQSAGRYVIRFEKDSISDHQVDMLEAAISKALSH